MHGLSNGPAIHLPTVYDFFKHSTMMDFGDGSGVYAIQVVKANPHMKATVLDLEAYAKWLNDISRAMLEDKALDFFKEDIPNGYDISFIRLFCLTIVKKKGLIS
jgi:16S rRNA G1207 methylase RsmC